jgi:hypothetical protein
MPPLAKACHRLPPALSRLRRFARCRASDSVDVADCANRVQLCLHVTVDRYPINTGEADGFQSKRPVES